MSGYTKLFNSILASTIWREDDKTRIVWITLLAMADKHGVCEGSIPGLADLARVSLQDCENALERLQRPDTYSRSKVSDGRRIAPTDGGWVLLNHGKYRQLMSVDERREYLRVKQQERRARERSLSTPVNSCHTPSTLLSHTEASPAPATKAKEREKESASLSAVSKQNTPSNGKRDPLLDDVVTERAARFIERYQGLYPVHRKGALYAVKPARDYAAAVTLCETWKEDTRLDKLAVCFLTTDHKFAEEGSRTIPQFLALASWCDGKLAEWEADRK